MQDAGLSPHLARKVFLSILNATSVEDRAVTLLDPQHDYQVPFPHVEVALDEQEYLRTATDSYGIEHRRGFFASETARLEKLQR